MEEGTQKEIADVFSDETLMTLEQLQSYGYPVAEGIGGIIVRTDSIVYGYVINDIEQKLYKPLFSYEVKNDSSRN